MAEVVRRDCTRPRGGESACLARARTRREERTIGRAAAEIADELLAAVNEHAPRVDVTATALAARGPDVAKVDDGYGALLAPERREGLDDEAERELGRDREVVRVREVVRRHPDEPRTRVACVADSGTVSSDLRLQPSAPRLTLVDRDKVGRGERSGDAGAGHERFRAVELLVDLPSANGWVSGARQRRDEGCVRTSWTVTGDGMWSGSILTRDLGGRRAPCEWGGWGSAGSRGYCC